MKTKHILISIIILISISLFSCEKDPSPPGISNFELGYDNSKIAYLGDELHIDADIVAEARIDRIEIEMHHEGEHKKSLTILLHGDEWEFDTIYTKFRGLKNTSFHEHIDIPVHAETGDYHFHFKVIDMEGNVTELEDEIEIKPKDIAGDISWQSGNFYILVKVRDAFGGNWTFSQHYPVVLSF
jgi:hypothetical protein